MNKLKSFIKKLFTSKSLKIVNYIFYVLAIAIFEFGYCNHTFTERLMQGEVTSFHFSICRGVIYIALLLLIFFVNKRFDFKEIEESFSKKTKKIIILTYLVVITIIALYWIIRTITTTGTVMIMPQLSMLLLTILGGFISVIYMSSNYTSNMVSIVLLGIVLAITCSTYHVIDEKKHFMEAYNISYFNLDFGNPVVDKQFMEEIPRGTHYTTMADYYKVQYNYEKGQIPENDEIDSSPASYNPILYIPSALGIFLGRILKGSVADVFYLGRIMNLFAYVALAILVLKIMPYKKNITFALLLLPMIICQAGTYTPDSLGMLLILVFVAYCFKLYSDKENITFRQLMLLVFLYCMTLTFKSMSYFFIGFLIFILPIKEIIKKYNKKILILILFAIVLLGIIMLIQPIGDISGGDPRGGETGMIPQLKNMIEHPTIILKVIFNHVTGTLLNYNWLSDMNFYGFFSLNSKWIFLIMLIYYIMIALKDDSINFGKKEKTIILITFLGIYGMTSAVLYLTFTPIGSEVLTGYSSRYLFPIILLVLICVSNDKLKNNDNKENEIIKINFINNLFIIVSLIGAIFKW